MDFVAASDESSDEEETIMEQEKLEENADYKQELDDLKVCVYFSSCYRGVMNFLYKSIILLGRK